jgi:methylglutaconyl-CoA hydratase
MSGGDGVLLVERRGDLLLVTLNDPDRANALGPGMIQEITELYRRPWREEGVRAILLSGAGKHFSAGADLAHLGSLRDASLEDNRADSLRLRDLFAAILEQDALTIAAVQGA